MHDQTMRSCNIETQSGFVSVKTYKTSSCKPDKNKVTAFTKIPVPTCKKQVQSFVGMISYLSKFSARLLEIAEPIRELAKDKVPFNQDPNINLLLHR